MVGLATQDCRLEFLPPEVVCHDPLVRTFLSLNINMCLSAVGEQVTDGLAGSELSIMKTHRLAISNCAQYVNENKV